MQKLFEGDNFTREETICRNTVSKKNHYRVDPVRIVAASCQIASRNLSITTWTGKSADCVLRRRSPGELQQSTNSDVAFFWRRLCLDSRYVKNLARISRKNKTSINIINPRFQPFQYKLVSAVHSSGSNKDPTIVLTPQDKAIPHILTNPY